MRSPRRSLGLCLTLLTVSAIILTAPLAAQQTATSESLAPYVPTPQDVVDRMLALAKVTKSDVVYDLGCGDGRIVVTAAKQFGAKGVGVDIDPQRIKESEANAEAAGRAASRHLQAAGRDDRGRLAGDRRHAVSCSRRRT